jgi:hypothetical protein
LDTESFSNSRCTPFEPPCAPPLWPLGLADGIASLNSSRRRWLAGTHAAAAAAAAAQATRTTVDVGLL